MTALKPTTLPRGIRNNNPGNIEWGDPWQGLLPVNERTDKRFCQFTSAVYGIRAICRVLISYQDKYQIKTISGAINRWAPPSENQTSAYVAAVAAMAKVKPDDQVDFSSYAVLKPVVAGIIRHENGVGAVKSDNTWYTSDEIDEGLRLAGVKPETKTAVKVPVTKETVGATTMATLGIAQIADVAPQVVAAIDHANDNISSGSVIRIILGLATIAIAIFVAYAQVKKHQKNVL